MSEKKDSPSEQTSWEAYIGNSVPAPEVNEMDRLREFFFGPKRKPGTTLEEQRKQDGLCPHCGERGRIHLSTFICSIHGVY